MDIGSNNIIFYTYSSSDSYNMEVIEFLEGEITWRYTEYTGEQVKCKLCMHVHSDAKPKDQNCIAVVLYCLALYIQLSLH